MSYDEGFYRYSFEYNQLMDFLNRNSVNGVIFLSGDRHHSEINKLVRPGNYDLYDITVSPFTSGVSKVRGAELNSPTRVPGSLVEQKNYARISVLDDKGERILQVVFKDMNGKSLFHWSISLKQLMTQKH